MCPLHCWDLGSQHQTTWLMHARSVGLAVLCFASTLSKRERSTTGLAWWQPWYGRLQASSTPIFAQHYVLTVGKYCTFSFCQCGKSSKYSLAQHCYIVCIVCGPVFLHSPLAKLKLAGTICRLRFIQKLEYSTTTTKNNVGLYISLGRVPGQQA